MKQKFTIQMIIGYAVVGVAILALIIYAVVGQTKEEKNFDVHLTEKEGSTYKTKLRAYKAKNNQTSTTIVVKSGYEETENVEPIAQVKKEPQSTQQAEVKTVTEEVKTVNKNPSRATSSKTSTTPTKSTPATAQEQKSTPSPSTSTGGSSEEKERRKKMMEASWGVVKSETPKAQTAGGAVTTFRGVISGTQTIKKGQIAILRVTEDMRVGEWLVPKNTLLYGGTMVSANRLLISVRTVRNGDEILPIALDVYGSDGLKGIPLNINQQSNAANKEIREEVVDQVGNVVKSAGGVGRVVGSVISGVGKSADREREQEIKLVDNQRIMLKIADK